MSMTDVNAGIERLNNQFMKPFITESQKWWLVDSDEGVSYTPTADLSLEEITAELTSVTETNMVEGFGARLSAPGYLDCTDWTVHPTIDEAKAYLVEMYDEYQRNLGNTGYQV